MATQARTPGSLELSVVSTDGEARSIPQSLPFLYLEIRRGRTGYPQRPVFSRNFLIGSGPGCDLRLGGEEIPAAHSLLTVTDAEVLLQWLAEGPPLLVNGEPAHEAALRDGDQIGIGRFEFTVHRILQPADIEDTQHQNSSAKPTEDSPIETASLLSLVSQAKASEATEDLSEISASELVARLEADQAAVENFEEALREGEAALLYAAAQRAEDLGEEDSDPIDHSSEPAGHEPVEAEILEELEKVIHQLSGFSEELDQRAKRLANQEATQAEAAELLLDAQKELAAQLERFHQQVTETQDHPEPKLRRAA